MSRAELYRTYAADMSVCKLPKWLVTTTTAPVLLKWHDDGTNSRTKRSELPRKIDRALGFRCLDC